MRTVDDAVSGLPEEISHRTGIARPVVKIPLSGREGICAGLLLKTKRAQKMKQNPESEGKSGTCCSVIRIP